MSQADPAGAAGGAGVPAALVAPLERFVFNAESWALPATLAHRAGMALPQPSRPDPAALRRVIAQALPPRRLSLDALTRDLRGRLALLPRADWLKLGLCVSVLPYSGQGGQILHSMDGHFRRAVRQGLDEPALEALDSLAEAGERPVFLLGANAWREPARVAAAGVRAAVQQALRWPDPVSERFSLQFTPDELAQRPSVSGLDTHWLEIACKVSLPDHPWLWS